MSSLVRMPADAACSSSWSGYRSAPRRWPRWDYTKDFRLLFGSMQRRTLSVTPWMQHFSERTDSSSTKISTTLNSMLSLSLFSTKRHRVYCNNVSCLCFSRRWKACWAMYARQRPAEPGSEKTKFIVPLHNRNMPSSPGTWPQTGESVDPQSFEDLHLLVLEPPDVIHGSDQRARQAQAHRSSLAESRTSATYLHPWHLKVRPNIQR